MKRLFAAAAVAALAGVAHSQAAPTPPTVPQRPYEVKGPESRNDPYYWLRDDSRKNPEMLAYLKAENAYADAVLAPTKPLQDKLFNEIVGRIKQDDSTVPFRKRGYFYYTRFETGAEYPVVARKSGSLEAKEQIMLDEPAMAKGPRLLRGRRLERQPGQSPARLCRGYGRPPAIHAEGEGPRDREDAGRHGRRTSSRTSSGPTTTRRSSISRRTR